MTSLQRALRGAGLVSEREFQETATASQLHTESVATSRTKRVREQERLLTALREGSKTANPDSFRREARKLLLLAPELVQEVLNLAHARGMHNKQKQGGGRLIANLYEVRQALGTKTDDGQATVAKLFSNK